MIHGSASRGSNSSSRLRKSIAIDRISRVTFLVITIIIFIVIRRVFEEVVDGLRCQPQSLLSLCAGHQRSHFAIAPVRGPRIRRRKRQLCIYKLRRRVRSHC